MDEYGSTPRCSSTGVQALDNESPPNAANELQKYDYSEMGNLFRYCEERSERRIRHFQAPKQRAYHWPKLLSD